MSKEEKHKKMQECVDTEIDRFLDTAGLEEPDVTDLSRFDKYSDSQLKAMGMEHLVELRKSNKPKKDA